MAEESAVLNNRYRLVDQIGEGGMAKVYRAQDLVLGRTVAIKVLRPQYSADPSFLARFQQEAQAAARLTHPNIVAVYDVGQDGGRHYIVMEYVEGPSLADLIARSAPFPVEKALKFAIQICAAVGFAHRAGIVHRDIKPHNVMMTAEGLVKVTDFGLAYALSPSAVTEDGTVWGTPHYLSPEQATGKNVAPASDVYSIGIVMYEMLTGKLPFEADNTVAVALMHIHEQPPPLRSQNPLVPPGLAGIVNTALAKEPAARYRTADHLGQVLKDYRRSGDQATSFLPSARPPARAKKKGDKPTITGRTPTDWLALLLSSTAVLALLGLIPIWTLVFRRYNLPVPTPTVVLVPTATSTVVLPTVTPTVFTLPPEKPPEKVRVPDLVGLEQEEARRLLTVIGLRLEVVEERYDGDVPPLSVISQTVPAGQWVHRDETVGVVISQGPEPVAVPNLVGQRVRIAELRLNLLGLVAKKWEEWSPDAVGVVLEQDPAPGSLVPQGSVVALRVSNGPRLVLNAVLADQIRLVACEPEAIELRAGSTLLLTLYWQALRDLEADYVVFVHLADPEGDILVQKDNPPQGGTRPTSLWTQGEQLADFYELVIPANAPAGIYWLKVGLYAPDSMQRLPVVDPGQATVDDQDAILVHPITVVRP